MTLEINFFTGKCFFWDKYQQIYDAAMEFPS